MTRYIQILGYATRDGATVRHSVLSLAVDDDGSVLRADVFDRPAPPPDRPEDGVVEFCPLGSEVFLWGKAWDESPPGSPAREIGGQESKLDRTGIGSDQAMDVVASAVAATLDVATVRELMAIGDTPLTGNGFTAACQRILDGASSTEDRARCIRVWIARRSA